jgi:hypothetical protein
LESDFDALKGKSSAPVELVARVAMRLSGIGDEAEAVVGALKVDSPMTLDGAPSSS